MGTSAPDVDGTSVFQLEGEQQRIAFLSSGWLIVSDDPSFSHLVHNVRQGNTLSLGKAKSSLLLIFLLQEILSFVDLLQKICFFLSSQKAFLLNLNTSFVMFLFFRSWLLNQNRIFRHISIFLSRSAEHLFEHFRK